VHLRRALLLFAIVLGLAAVAASVSRQGEESSDAPPPASDRREPPIAPGSSELDAETAATVELDASADQRRRAPAGRPTTLLVEVDEPGLVEIPDLGESAPGDPVTPARFELLVREPDSYPVVFTPAASDEPEAAGTLVMTEPER
jgi:hypothetical protein